MEKSMKSRGAEQILCCRVSFSFSHSPTTSQIWIQTTTRNLDLNMFSISIRNAATTDKTAPIPKTFLLLNYIYSLLFVHRVITWCIRGSRHRDGETLPLLGRRESQSVCGGNGGRPRESSRTKRGGPVCLRTLSHRSGSLAGRMETCDWNPGGKSTALFLFSNKQSQFSEKHANKIYWKFYCSIIILILYCSVVHFYMMPPCTINTLSNKHKKIMLKYLFFNLKTI